jgi:hypothetical protein
MVDPLCYTACRALRQPISHPIKYMITLNPTVAHTQSPHLASIVSLARFFIIDFSARKLQHNFLHMISTEVSSLATHNSGVVNPTCTLSCAAALRDGDGALVTPIDSVILVTALWKSNVSATAVD